MVNRVPVSHAALRRWTTRARSGAGGGPLADRRGELASVLAARASLRAEGVAALEAFAKHDHAIWRVPLAPVDPSAKDVARWLRAEGAG
jgi:hypothetical protein